MHNYFDIKHISILTKWLLVALFLFPILPLNITNILFISFCSISILAGCASYKYIQWKHIRRSYLISLAFIPYMIEYLMNTNDHLMQIEFLKKLPFIFAPLAFSFFFTMNKRVKADHFINAFTIATTIIALISITTLLYNNELFTPESYKNGAFLIRQKFEIISNLHPTYFGLFACLSIFWLLTKSFHENKNIIVIYSLFIFILLFTQILLAAKAPFFITIIGSIWILYKKVKPLSRFAIISGILILCSFIVSITAPSLKNRINEVEDFLISNNMENNTINQRQLILNCNTELFLENIWMGVKTKNTQHLLDECYQSKSKEVIEKNKYNSHNQFFTLGISYGLFFLLIFIFSLYRILLKTKNNIYYQTVIWVFILIMLSESILERQMGVYAFLFFILLIINSNKQTRSMNISGV